MKEKKDKEARERKRERSAGFKEPTQWLKSLLPLSISTRTSTRRNLSSWTEGWESSVLAFFPAAFLSFFLLPFLSHRRSKFISRSYLFWTFHNIWPRFGIRYWWALVTKRYDFESFVMDGSLFKLPRTALFSFSFSFFVSSLSLSVFLSLSLFLALFLPPVPQLPFLSDKGCQTTVKSRAV